MSSELFDESDFSQFAEKTVYIQSKWNGLCLDVEGGRIYDGAKVIQFEYNGGNNQLWNISQMGNQYVIRSVKNNNYVLAVNYSNELIIRNFAANSSDQLWQFRENELLYNNNSLMYLDVPGFSTDQGVQLITYEKNGGLNQKWEIKTEVSWIYQENSYLAGYATENGNNVTKHLSSLEEAKNECIRINKLSNSVCSGFTKGRDGTYTLRKESEFITSPSGEESWLRNDDSSSNYSSPINQPVISIINPAPDASVTASSYYSTPVVPPAVIPAVNPAEVQAPVSSSVTPVTAPVYHPLPDEGKTCRLTIDGTTEIHENFCKEFYWHNIHRDSEHIMNTDTGFGRTWPGHKNVQLLLRGARRILNIETDPSDCSVSGLRIDGAKSKEHQVCPASQMTKSYLSQTMVYSDHLEFECSEEIITLTVGYTDLVPEYKVYPRLSIPVTNAVKVWDSYCKTSVNKGSASRAYLVGNDPSNDHFYATSDFNGITCDSRSGFRRYYRADNPAFIAVFFGFRIRVCNFFVSMPNKAPAKLALFMDGNEIARVTEDALDKVSDLLDWYNAKDSNNLNQNKDPNDLVGSSFKLVWPCDENGDWREAYLTRITISYTEPGHPVRHWKSTLGRKDSSQYKNENNWTPYATEHPKMAEYFDGTWFEKDVCAYISDSLCKPGRRWVPMEAGDIGYPDAVTDLETSSAQNDGALKFECAQEINLAAFILNFPDFGEKIHDNYSNSSRYTEKSRHSIMKLSSISGDKDTERVIAELGAGQIVGNRLNLLDYRKTKYLSQIKTLYLRLQYRGTGDAYEGVMNSVEIFFYINEFTPQKVWESTHRLRKNHLPLSSLMAVKDDAVWRVSDRKRCHGHTKQMITEGFPHYWKSGDLKDRWIEVEFSGFIVMTSFIFETCRKYRKDSYRQVKLQCESQGSQGSFEVLCETPETVGSRNGTQENWSPGDYIEMFDHKKIKHMPFITGKKFRLSFQDDVNNKLKVAVGKISIGYYDVDDESRDCKWEPGDFDKARIIHPAKENLLDQINSNPFTFWSSNETFYLQVQFLEKVKIKNVILGFDIAQSGNKYYPDPDLKNGRLQPHIGNNGIHKDLQLIIDSKRVAFTSSTFVPEEYQTFIHFFRDTEYRSELSNDWMNERYRENVSTCNEPYDGQNVEIKWANNKDKSGEKSRAATLEIIYSKIISSDLMLAERACLAAHNNYRFQHGLSLANNYRLAYTNGKADSLMTSARVLNIVQKYNMTQKLLLLISE